MVIFVAISFNRCVMKKYLFALAELALLFACTAENVDPNSGKDIPSSDKTVHVTGVSLDRTSVTIKEGETVALVATVKPDNADNKNVSWSSSDVAVASVDNSGKVTGIKAGSATVTVKTEDEEKTASCVVTVDPNSATSVTIGADNISAISVVLKGKANLTNSVSSDLRIGFQYSKSAGILPSNSIMIDAEDADANYIYTTSITGLEPGMTYYFRSFVRQNGMDEYGETMEFKTKNIESLLETREATGVGATQAALNAKLDLTDIKYSNVGYGFYWGTSESSQTTYLKGGNIVDHAYSATMSNLSHKTQYWYKAYVMLNNHVFYGEVKTFTTDVVKVESVSLDMNEYTFNTIGNVITLKSTVLPADATDNSVEWSSSNEDVAAVDQSGRVTAKSNGTATITVTTKDQGKTSKCTVTVAQWLTSIEITSSLTLNVNKTASLSITVLPNNAKDKTVSWFSSNDEIATVDNNGKVEAKSVGSASIRVVANDGSGVSASCDVKVIPMGVVDMGTSVYWATTNLSLEGLVNSTTSSGSYFAWGEISRKNDYTWTTYKWCNGNDHALTKYCPPNMVEFWGGVGDPDGIITLDEDDDAAHVILGDGWRIPTLDEWVELFSICSLSTYAGYGVYYIRLSSRITGESLVIPGTRYFDGTTWKGTSESGHYWSSTVNNSNPKFANTLHVSPRQSPYYNLGSSFRYFGYNIRPVHSK